MLKWKDEYSIGVLLIDEQHKYFFKIGNNTYSLLNNECCLNKYPKVIQIIEDLRQYAEYHFKCEEEYMLQINYKGYYDQKKEHEAFLKEINSFNLDYIEQDQDKFIRELLLFIYNWFTNHILYKDKLIKSE